MTTGSPSREHTINYVLGSGEEGKNTIVNKASYQGYSNTYVDYKGLMKK